VGITRERTRSGELSGDENFCGLWGKGSRSGHPNFLGVKTGGMVPRCTNVSSSFRAKSNKPLAAFILPASPSQTDPPCSRAWQNATIRRNRHGSYNLTFFVTYQEAALPCCASIKQEDEN
jgi:hypothetical protein